MTTLSLIIVLRAIHILAGVIWAGGALALVLFFGQEAFAEGDNSASGLQGMRAAQKRIAIATGISALLAVLAGMALFGMLHARPQTTGDMVLSAGALAALLSFPAGGMIGGPAKRYLAKLADVLTTENRTASPGEIVEIESARARVRLAAEVAAALLTVTVLCMATWRYF